MNHKMKTKHKIISILLAVTLLASVLVIQASAFVNLTPDNTGSLYYAINPIADIESELLVECYDGSLYYLPAHISVISAGTPGTGSTFGDFHSGRPSAETGAIYGKYQVQTTGSRIWTTFGDQLGYPPSEVYSKLEGLKTQVAVRFDTYIINANMGSELNFELPSLYRDSSVNVYSSYSGNVSYPKKDGSLGNAYFELSFTNTYPLTKAPDGNLEDHIKVRHYTSPTPLYANQNPQYVDQMAVYRDAFDRLSDTLQDQYVHPDTIERWILDEGYSFPPICSNYTSSFSMEMGSTGIVPTADEVVVGMFASTDPWTGMFGNYLAVNSSLASLKATASKYDFTEVITNAINNTMHIQIFPDFTIGEIFLIVGGLGILVLLLKIFLGG